MKAGWSAHTRRINTNKFVTSFGKDGPLWDNVVGREIFDVDAGIMLEDKAKDVISKRVLHKTLGRKMTLKIIMYTDTKRKDGSKWPEHGSELGDLPETVDYPEDHGGGPGSS